MTHLDVLRQTTAPIPVPVAVQLTIYFFDERAQWDVRVLRIYAEVKRAILLQDVNKCTSEPAIEGLFFIQARGDYPRPTGGGGRKLQPRPTRSFAAVADVQYEQGMRTDPVMILDPAQPCLYMIMAPTAIITVDVQMVVCHATVAQDMDDYCAGGFLPTLLDHFLDGITEYTAAARKVIGFSALTNLGRIVKLLKDIQQFFSIARRIWQAFKLVEGKWLTRLQGR